MNICIPEYKGILYKVMYCIYYPQNRDIFQESDAFSTMSIKY